MKLYIYEKTIFKSFYRKIFYVIIQYRFENCFFKYYGLMSKLKYQKDIIAFFLKIIEISKGVDFLKNIK